MARPYLVLRRQHRGGIDAIVSLLACASGQWHNPMPGAPYAGRCLLLRSSGGGREAAHHATMFSI